MYKRQVDADFGAAADTVLTFPEFNQPCSVIIVKINRFAVKYHFKMWCRVVKKTCIAKGALPRINIGCDNILLWAGEKSKRLHQFVKQLFLCTGAHIADFLDNPFSAPVKKDRKKNAYQDENAEENVHRKILELVFIMICGWR